MKNVSLDSLVIMGLEPKMIWIFFWALFQLHPISDVAEDLATKIFSTTLYGNANKWYDSLLDVGITSMDQLEETCL